MTYDEFEKKIFYIYALNKNQLELYADGIVMIAENAGGDVDNVRAYWNDLEKKLIYGTYGELEKTLEGIGLKFRNLAGRLQKIEK